MAGGSIGTLKAMLLLDTSKWNSGFASAAKSVNGFAGGLLAKAEGSIAGFSSSLGAAALGAVTVSLSVRSLAESFSHVASLSGMSKRLGLTVEQTQKLSIAAEHSGVDMEMLAKYMFLMGKNIGSGGMPLDKRLMQVADEISRIPDPAERAAMAFKVFGKGGYEMLGLLMKGSEGIRRSADAVDRFGLAISDIDAAKVKEAKLSLLELKTVLHGLKDQLAVEFAPTVTRFAQSWLTAFEQIGQGAKKLQSVLAFFGGKVTPFGPSTGATAQNTIGDYLDLMVLRSPIGMLAGGMGIKNKDFLEGMVAQRSDAARFQMNATKGMFGSGLSGGAAGKPAYGAPALERGSTEAYRAIIAAGGNTQEKIAADQLSVLKDIRDKLASGGKSKSLISNPPIRAARLK